MVSEEIHIRARRRFMEKIETIHEEQKLEKEKEKLKPARFLSISNVFFLLFSAFIFYYLEFVATVYSDPRINRFYLNVGLLFLSVTVGTAAFLIVYGSYICKMTDDQWEAKWPFLIPIATASFLVCCISFTIALWPVWNIITPVILFILFMGFIVIVPYLPI